MKPFFRGLARHAVDWLPPVIVRYLDAHVLQRAITYQAPYSSWQAAMAASSGYGEASILAAAAAAARDVIAGDADYDRDGVAFRGRRIESGVVACLLAAARNPRDRLCVLDFGGGLGSTYRQCLPMLGNAVICWNIVEQPQFVDLGQTEFQTEHLRFFGTIAGAVQDERPDIVLASSVLPYVEDPYRLLTELMDVGSPRIVIDRTPTVGSSQDILAVQKIPKTLYGHSAAYPAWCLSRERMISHISDRYRLVAEFDALDPGFQVSGESATPGGFLFELDPGNHVRL